MGKKNDVPLKEKYRLWYEYWKRSKEYDQTLAFIGEYKISDPKSFRLSVWQKFLADNSIFTRKLKKVKEGYISSSMDIKERLLSNPTFELMFSLLAYDREGVSFDEAWEKEEIKLLCQPLEDKWAVREYSEFFDDDVNYIVRDFQRRKGRNPTHQEFLLAFRNRLMSYRDRFVFSIHHTNHYSIQKMSIEFIKLLRKKRNSLEFKKEDRRLREAGVFLSPTKNAWFFEIKRYLRIYDLKKEGKTWRKIAKEVYPDKDFDNDLSTNLMHEKRKAEKIIENVNQGNFPGKL